jgi:hypothetical protein
MKKSTSLHGKIRNLNMFYLPTGPMFLVFEELPRISKVDMRRRRYFVLQFCMHTIIAWTEQINLSYTIVTMTISVAQSTGNIAFSFIFSGRHVSIQEFCITLATEKIK